MGMGGSPRRVLSISSRVFPCSRFAGIGRIFARIDGYCMALSRPIYCTRGVGWEFDYTAIANIVK